MAQLDVEKKKNDDWWKWVVGILAAIVIIWVIVEATGTDDAVDDDMQRATMENPRTTSVESEIHYTYS
jgi:uncharacterized protein YpmS